MSDSIIQQIKQKEKHKVATLQINEADEHQYDEESSSENKTKMVVQPKNKNTISHNRKIENKKYKSAHKTQGITISKAKRQLNKPISVIDPGPCSYETQVLPRQQSVTFTKSSAHEVGNQKNANRVGPGSYYPQQNPKLTKKALYTIGCKYQSHFDVKNKDIPGPGQYDSLPQIIASKKSKNYSPNKGFGTSVRFSMDELGPGPGSYQTFRKDHESLNKKRTISNSGRQFLNKLQHMPGPGNYQKVSSFDLNAKKNKGVTIALRHDRKSQTNLTTEAFNKYTIKRQFEEGNQALGFTIGQQKQKFIVPCQTPSPQDYDSHHLYPHVPAAKISQSKSYVMKVVQTPGPGAYDENNQKHPIKYSFSKSKSSSILSTAAQNPGVGKYEINQKMVKAAIKGSPFSKQKKFIANSSTVSMGVGDYNISMILNQSKGYTIPKAFDQSRLKNA